MRSVITLLVPDRVGILHEITTTVTDLGASIEGISQTVVAGYFTVTLVASFGDATDIDVVRKRMQEKFGGDTSVIGVVPYSPPAPAPAGSAEPYIITITGPDSPGILKTVTAFLAQRRINIDDWYLLFSLPHVTHVGEITVPSTLDFGHLQTEFGEAMRKLGLKARIQHENIFRATNEIGPIKALLTEKTDAY
jgi:predicted amino acid-binding ACT domain protein